MRKMDKMLMNLRIASWQSLLIEGPETQVVLTDPKHLGEGDAISVQHIQMEEKHNYWTKTVRGWIKSLYKHQ